MNILNFQKETSEKSESENWVLEELSASSLFHFSGFEGCNENADDRVTNLLDRASIVVDGDLNALPPQEQIESCIDKLEGGNKSRKLNFCNLVGAPYEYIFYNYTYRFVLRYEVSQDAPIFRERYESFEAFSSWIQTIKGWHSTKAYKAPAYLPEFDRALRLAGCPWPTNVDSVVFDNNDLPIAIIEFQNAERTGVNHHDNNNYFLPTFNSEEKCYKPAPDYQRWLSQEILRVSSNLTHLTIVWSQNENICIIKRLNRVSFPDYSNKNNSLYYQLHLSYFNYYRQFDRDNPKYRNVYNTLRTGNYTFQLSKDNGRIIRTIIGPPLSGKEMTFPFLYMDRYGPYNKGNVTDGLVEALNIGADQ